jgi:hypothetical protein
MTKEGTPQYIHVIHKKKTFRSTEFSQFMQENPFIQNKQLITISPGGFYGFYMLGICKYIKENYDLSRFIFSGASAGAWNSLMLSYRGNLQTLQDTIIDESLQYTKTIPEMENLIKRRILGSYTTTDFDLRRLFIGVTTLHKYTANTTIFTGFENLEDAIHGCIASSHIPFITGNWSYVYQNRVSFDGGFSHYPYLRGITPAFHITPSMWRPRSASGSPFHLNIRDYTSLFSKDKFVFQDMIQAGYTDAGLHKPILDSVFLAGI